MPHVFRLGCAGAALIVIAALTSVGLYAVVAGGVPWGGAGGRSSASGAPVLVTIQAAPVTPTSALTAATATPAPAALLPRAGAASSGALPPSTAPAPAAAGPALTAPAPAVAAPAPAEPRLAATAPAASATTPAASASTPAPALGAPAPTVAIPRPDATSGPPAAGARPDAASASASAASAARASHEGLTLEIVEVERGWQAKAPDGSVLQRRDGSELMTVHVRLSNEAAELRFLADTDLVLVAEDGARLAPRQAPPLREPHLLTVPVAPRDSVRGWLTFEVPAGLEPRRLQWSPTRPDRPRADATYLLPLPN